MSDTTPALDGAFEPMAAASFELPNGFVNHGAMACEALAVLDCAGDIDSWARRLARAGGAPVDPVVPAGFRWRQALGGYRRLPEWIGCFTQAIDGGGWPAVVAARVPRLMPAPADRAVPRRHPDRPCRAGHRRGRHAAAAR